MKSTMCWIMIIMLASGCLARHHQTNQIRSLGFEKNFLSVNIMTNGQHEKRLVYDGIAAKETYVTAKQANRELALWQVTDGVHFIQSIYYGQQLQDCEYVKDPEEVSKFLKEFQDDEQELQFLQLNPEVSMNMTNISRRVLDNEDPPEDMQRMLHLHLLKRECDERHEMIKADQQIDPHQISEFNQINEFDQIDEIGQGSRQKRSISIFPGTKWCGPGNLPTGEGIDPLGGRNHADRCCRRHDKCPYNIRPFKSKYGIRNLGLNTMSHCSCDFRFKRETEEIFRIPNTQWCGRGFDADEYGDVGGFLGTDRCCRDHDLNCPFYIEAWDTKYGLTNWLFYTLNHCNCDERFRTCLKRVDTGASNLVGKIFFNIAQTKCIVFKPEKVCAQSSWWGKCQKWVYKKKAVLRDPVPY